VIRDEVDPASDNALATFVINSHMKSHPLASDEEYAKEIEESLLDETNLKQNSDSIIDQDFLKKYILYARKYVKPKLSDIEKEKIATFYSEIRKYSSAVGGIPIGVRHIESMLRMSEAHAKMHLREFVRAEDVNLAIRMLLESFMQSQKQSVASSLRPKFAKYLSRSEDDF